MNQVHAGGRSWKVLDHVSIVKIMMKIFKSSVSVLAKRTLL
jgi:hypothetical protein